jgi:hypothetical protein
LYIHYTKQNKTPGNKKTRFYRTSLAMFISVY